VTGLVLDNEALQVLAHPHHPKHSDLLAFVEAEQRAARRTRREPRLRTSSVARVEAGLDRTSPASAAFNRFRVGDIPVTAERADRATRLNADVGASAVDACVAELAESLGETTVITSDVPDLSRLLADTRVVVHRL
jgi:hypothetical protein